MKFAFAVILASVLALQGHALPAPEAEVEARAEQVCGFATVALLRGYSKNAGDHFYTTNAVEMENAIGHLGYVSEGTAGRVFPSQAPDSVPFYRLYSSAGGNHFYTTDAAERNNAINNLGFRDEGVAAYVYTRNLCGSVPLYRMFRPEPVSDHFYTTDAAERNRAITTLGYVDEGIAAFINPQ